MPRSRFGATFARVLSLSSHERRVGSVVAVVAASSLALSVQRLAETEANVRSYSWNSNWDGKSSQRSEKPCARHILLVRHGQYVDAKEDSNRVLTPLGREQARLLGQRLKAMDLKLTRIDTSTMTRAGETSEIIAQELGGLPIVKNDALREGRPAVPDPLGSRRVEDFERDVKAHGQGARIEGAFNQFFYRPTTQHEDSWELIVGHANVFRYFTMRALQLPPEAWLRTSIGNCSIIWLKIRSDGVVTLRAFGDIGHLPWDCVTFA